MNRWLFFLSVVFASCGVNVVDYLNEQARFNTFESYVLLGMKGQNLGESSDQMAIIRRMENAVVSEMTRRGYRKTDDDPDLILRYEIISGSRTEQNNTNSFYFAPPTSRQFTESIILLEMTNFETKKLVWQASLDLREHHKITKRKDVLTSAVQNIFNTYLYRAGSSQKDETLITK